MSIVIFLSIWCNECLSPCIINSGEWWQSGPHSLLPLLWVFFSWMLFCNNSGLSNTCSSCYLVFSAGTCPCSPKVSGFPTANKMTHKYIQISLTLLELAVVSSTLPFSFHLTFCLNIQKAICLGAARTYPVLLLSAFPVHLALSTMPSFVFSARTCLFKVQNDGQVPLGSCPAWDIF